MQDKPSTTSAADAKQSALRAGNHVKVWLRAGGLNLTECTVSSVHTQRYISVIRPDGRCVQCRPNTSGQWEELDQP